MNTFYTLQVSVWNRALFSSYLSLQIPFLYGYKCLSLFILNYFWCIPLRLLYFLLNILFNGENVIRTINLKKQNLFENESEQKIKIFNYGQSIFGKVPSISSL